jgi:hypothetical protein
MMAQLLKNSFELISNLESRTQNLEATVKALAEQSHAQPIESSVGQEH